jgi:hypothetical protein
MRQTALFPPGDIDFDNQSSPRASHWRAFQMALWALRVGVLGFFALLKCIFTPSVLHEKPRRRLLATIPHWCSDALS